MRGVYFILDGPFSNSWMLLLVCYFIFFPFLSFFLFFLSFFLRSVMILVYHTQLQVLCLITSKLSPKLGGGEGREEGRKGNGGVQ